MQSFFMVWNTQRDSPTVCHATYESATAEAERLAQKCPGETFVILESVGQVVSKTTQFTPHTRSTDDGIPF